MIFWYDFLFANFCIKLSMKFHLQLRLIANEEFTFFGRWFQALIIL